jgi:hypothetical protein
LSNLPTNVTDSRADRWKLTQLVLAHCQKNGLDPAAVRQSGDVGSVMTAIRGSLARNASAPGSFDVDRALKNAATMLANKPLYAQFAMHGGVRGPSPLLPDAVTRPQLTNDQRVAFQQYSGIAYSPLNDSLRTTGQPPAGFEVMHANMQGVFQSLPKMAQPVTCFRGINIDPANLASFLDDYRTGKAAGQAIRLGGYQSTMVGAPDPFFKGNVMFKIQANRGLDMKPHTHYPHTNELLLDHNSEFRVKGIRATKGGYTIELEQIDRGTLPLVGSGVATKAPKTVNPAAVPQPKTPKKFSVPARDYKGSSLADRIADSAVVQGLLVGTIKTRLHDGHAGGRRDRALDKLAAETGRANLPKVVDAAEMATLEQQGWRVAYRGMKDKAGKTGAEMHDQFRTGDLYSGAGVYGNGTYMAMKGPTYDGKHQVSETATRSTAMSYAGHNPKNVAAYLIPPTARVADVDKLKSERAADLADLSRDLATGKIDRHTHRKMSEICRDLGRYATLKNYDAIATNNSDGFFVLLNRSIAAISKGAV